MGFGYEVKGLNDRKVNAAKKLVDLAGAATFPGALLVNDLPFRKCSLVSGKLFGAHSHQYDTSPNGFHG
jgi:hypothetical protein